jgi:CheY-like chemotaxis protein
MNDSRATIVTVDDDEDTVTVLCDFFTMLGMTPVRCMVGTDIVACVRQYQPRVVILDVLLDGTTTGVDVLHHLRADPAMHTVPVVFFSGSEDALRRLLPDYTAHGATFVAKPNIDKLMTMVGHLVQNST